MKKKCYLCVLIVYIIISLISCNSNKILQQTNQSTLEINTANGFDINVINDSLSGETKFEIENNCKDINLNTWYYYMFLSVTDPNGYEIHRRDSLGIISHYENTYFRKGEVKPWIVDESSITEFFYRINNPISGIYEYKMEYNHDGCHFDIRINKEVYVR